MSNSNNDADADPSGVELQSGAGGKSDDNGSSGGGDDRNSCKFLCIPCPCKHSGEKQHAEYLAYHDRRCTNLVCLICYIFFLIAWAVIFGFSWKYGKPDVLTHAMDSHGNICGVTGSNVVEIGGETVTNKYSDGKAPHDLATAKVGMFPRIASDIAAQLSKLQSKGSSALTDITFTQLCVSECPMAGDVVCGYKFLSNWNGALDSGNKNPVTDREVRRYMRLTGEISRELALGQGARVKNACSSAGSAEKIRMCEEAFVQCDIVPANSKAILGRCVPYIDIGPQSTVERCVEPLTATECDPTQYNYTETGSTADFNTQCIQSDEKDSNGTFIHYVPTYIPVPVGGELDSFKLDNDGNTHCITMERKGEQTQVIIPQARYLSYLTSAASTIAQYMGDIQTAWYVVLSAGLACPLVVSFVYTCIMRKCAAQMVWCAIFLFLIANLAVAFMCLVKGGAVPVAPLVALLEKSGGDSSNSTQSAYSIRVSEDYGEYYLAAGFVLLIAFIIVVCMVLFARKAIQTSVYIVEMSAKAIAHLKSLVLFPIISFFGVAATGTVFIVCGILLLTAGEIKTAQLLNETMAAAGSSGNSSDFDAMLLESFEPTKLSSVSVLNYLMIFDLFMFLWTTEFIQAIGIMTVGGAVSHWYFAPGESDGGNEDSLGEKEVDQASHGHSHPCCCSYWISMRFHLGSAAFGSVIIATMNMIRIAFEYVQHKIDIASDGIKNRCWFKCIVGMLRCCLWCLTKCIRFLSKQAYIYTAIKGEGFCSSAVRSYHLIWNNLLRFGATNTVTAILMILGKIMVCLFSMMFGYAWVNYSAHFNDRTKDTYITSSLFISIAILMLSYLVAEAFFNIFHVAIDTSLLCYSLDLADKKTNKSKRSATMKKSVAGIGKHDEALHDELEPPSWVNNKCCARCC